LLPDANLLRRNVLLPLAALAVGAMAVMVVVVLMLAYRQDVDRFESNARLLRAAIDAELESARSTAVDYSWWDAALQEARWRGSRRADSRPLGPWLATQFDYGWTFVLDPRDRTVYASNNGQPRSVSVFDVFSGGLPGMVEAARDSRDGSISSVSALLTARGRPQLVALAAIVTDVASSGVRGDVQPVLVIARELDGPLLREIGASLRLADLRFERGGPSPRREAIELTSADGRRIGMLTWRTPRLLGQVMPPLAIGLFAVGIFGLVALRETRAAAQAIARSERRFRDFAESASDWYWELDADLRLTDLSERFQAVSGREPQSCFGRRFAEVAADDPAGPSWESLETDLALRRPFRGFVCVFRDGLGRRRTVQLNGRPVFDRKGRFTGYRGTGSDITERVEAEERIRYLAQHDALTDLPNRLLLADRLVQAIALARRQGRMVAVLCLDLDDFKGVNDTLGHAAGDTLLREMGRRLKETVRETDTVARIGGDEFVIVQTDIDGRDAPTRLAKRLLDRLGAAYHLDGHSITRTASIGIACFSEDGETAEELVRHADLALYRAKADGRGRHRFWRSDFERRHPTLDQAGAGLALPTPARRAS
jgi:diguanylate cyclase (GGDEF)-like protein/PAS domain S-box-containing protein